MGLPIISSDGHIVEPPKLFVERLDRKYSDKAPHVEDKGNGPVFVAPGVPDFIVASFYCLNKEGDEFKEAIRKGYDVARPGAWDPMERIKDMDIDGVAAEIIYPSLGFSLYGLSDVELQLACFKAYNDWMAEFASVNPKRLAPVALIPLEDVPAGIEELHRAKKLGLRGAMIWSGPPADRPYHCGIYENFFAACQDLDMPVVMHEITAKDKRSTVTPAQPVEYMTSLVNGFLHEIQITLCSLIFGGILDRYPKLKVVSVELGAGWAPYFVWQMDRRHKKFAAMAHNYKLSRLPSEVAAGQIFWTFEIDPVGPRVAKVWGENNYMWASDYPHSATTWPKSLDVIANIFSDTPEEMKNKILSYNCDRLFHLGLS
jgi:predicted TIM-barrel fold metal-dependent hydrolase